MQVAGPNAQRQIQQINAMVQAGAKAIVVYPISPTALNAGGEERLRQGRGDHRLRRRDHRALRLQRHIDQHEAGRVTAEWLAKKLDGKGNIVVITGVPGTSVDTLRTKAAKEVFAKNPGIKIIAEGVGMWSQAVARTELSKILATHNWDADRRAVDAGRLLHRERDGDRSRHRRDKLKPCAGEGSNGGRIQMLPVGDTRSRAPTAPTRRWARRASPTPRRPIPARSR